jgi:hypothetical protein
MINVSLGNNERAVTLRERVVIAAPFYLMGLTFKGDNNAEKLLLVTDSSAATDRVNCINFEIVATEGAEDLANGKVYLIGGNYNYRIFERLDNSLTLVDSNLLEKGIVRYDTESNVTTEYNKTDNDFTYGG